MTLIPLEVLGAPSQKTSLLGGVVQILIFPRPSPRLADVGLFVRPKSQQSPLEQRVSLQAQLSSHRKIKCSIEIQLFTAWGDGTPYVKYHQLQSVTPLHRVVAGTPIAKEHHCQISREPNINFTGAYCAFCAIGGIYIVEHHPHT